MKKIVLTVVLLACAPALVWAGEKPDANTVRQVMNYYHSGSDVTLIEHKICTEIASEGELKNECSAVVDGSSVEEGSKVYFWMNFLVPGDEAEGANVLVQFKYKGKAVSTYETSMSQAIRYRTWRLLPTNKAGSWQVSIEQEKTDGYTSIETINYSVVEPSAVAEM